MFGKKKELAPVAAEPEVQVEIAEETEAPVPAGTIIGPGVVFNGNFTANEKIDIQGSVVGDIYSSTELYIAKSGSYKGNADVENILVEGLVDGDLVCRDCSRFTETSTMRGTLTTAHLETVRGTRFEGGLTLKDFQPQQPPAELQPEAESESFVQETTNLLEDGDIEATEENIFA